MQCKGVMFISSVVSEKLSNRCAFERSNEPWRGLFFEADQTCQKTPDLIINSCLSRWGRCIRDLSVRAAQCACTGACAGSLAMKEPTIGRSARQ